MILEYEALDLYERARRRSTWHRVGALLRGRSADLLDLARITAGSTISARRSLGAQIVPIWQIRGSEGRRTDFDDTFHPLQKHTRSPWLGIAMAWLEGVNLPPVDLIRLGDIYFVRDGHHRISVVRALGLQEIEAVVTVWEVAASQGSESTSVGTPRRALAWLGSIQHWGVSLWRDARLILSPTHLGEREREPSELSTIPCDSSGTAQR
jgi:hypothetical protein